MEGGYSPMLYKREHYMLPVDHRKTVTRTVDLRSNLMLPADMAVWLKVKILEGRPRVCNRAPGFPDQPALKSF